MPLIRISPITYIFISDIDIYVMHPMGVEQLLFPSWRSHDLPTCPNRILVAIDIDIHPNFHVLSDWSSVHDVVFPRRETLIMQRNTDFRCYFYTILPRLCPLRLSDYCCEYGIMEIMKAETAPSPRSIMGWWVASTWSRRNIYPKHWG
jgi:hypothetical protein